MGLAWAPLDEPSGDFRPGRSWRWSPGRLAQDATESMPEPILILDEVIELDTTALDEFSWRSWKSRPVIVSGFRHDSCQFSLSTVVIAVIGGQVV